MPTKVKNKILYDTDVLCYWYWIIFFHYKQRQYIKIETPRINFAFQVLDSSISKLISLLSLLILI